MPHADAPDFFDALPRELVLLVLDFLSGFDLLPLSQVSKRFHAQFLGPKSECWTRHVPRTMRVGPYEWRALASQGWTYVRPRPALRRMCPESAQRQHDKREAVLKQRVQERTTRELELLADAKRHYFESVSVQFPGLLDNARKTSRWTDGRVTLPEQCIRGKWARDSFSFDLWMALLPVSSSSARDGGSNTVGGVVFSAQSSPWCQENEASPVAAQFVHVDHLGGLYCSVASDAKRVLATLSISRWYHLTLTFERSPIDGTAVQRVYLDGECIDLQQGALRLPDQWSQFHNYQLGTGFMETGAVGCPEVQLNRSRYVRTLAWLMDTLLRRRPRVRARFRGDFAFHGLLDEFRLWRGVLTPTDIRDLIIGLDCHVSGGVTCDWSLMADADYRSLHGDLWAVASTRPTERVCQNVRKAFLLWTRDALSRLPVPRC